MFSARPEQIYTELRRSSRRVPSVAKRNTMLICAICGYFLNFEFCSFKFVSDFELRISDLPRYLSPSKVKKRKKMVQKVFIFVNFC